MKRSEFIEDIATEIILAACETKHEGPVPNMGMAQDMAESVLKMIEETGFLPPVQSPSLIEVDGVLRHGPALRVWDEE